MKGEQNYGEIIFIINFMYLLFSCHEVFYLFFGKALIHELLFQNIELNVQIYTAERGLNELFFLLLKSKFHLFSFSFVVCWSDSLICQRE